MLALFAAIFFVPFVAVYYLVIGLWMGGGWLVKYIQHRRQMRRAAIEAELDRKQDAVRATVLQLANALGMEAHGARKALIRESYLASGKVPPPQ